RRQKTTVRFSVVVLPDTGTGITAKRDCDVLRAGRDPGEPGGISPGAPTEYPKTILSVVGLTRFQEYGRVTVQEAVDPLRVAATVAASTITFFGPVAGPSVTEATAWHASSAVDDMFVELIVIEKFTTIVPVVWPHMECVAPTMNTDSRMVINFLLL